LLTDKAYESVKLSISDRFHLSLDPDRAAVQTAATTWLGQKRSSTGEARTHFEEALSNLALMLRHIDESGGGIGRRQGDAKHEEIMETFGRRLNRRITSAFPDDELPIELAYESKGKQYLDLEKWFKKLRKQLHVIRMATRLSKDESTEVS
jgi:hypothetical protein